MSSPARDINGAHPSSATAMQARGVVVELGGRRVLDDVDLQAEPGQVVGVVGPNGSGKSTLLRALTGLVPTADGQVRIDGRPIRSMRPRELARRVATVLQDVPADFDLTGRDVVVMGRACHLRPLQRESAVDHQIVSDAMDRLGVTHLAHRPFGAMSGGEKQRVLIARAVAQQPGLLVMDEPTNHLELRHQFQALRLPRELDVTAVIALHDLDLAAYYCDVVTVLHHGRQIATGPPEEVLDSDLLADIYQVRGRVWPDPDTGRTRVLLDPGPRTDEPSRRPARR